MFEYETEEQYGSLVAEFGSGNRDYGSGGSMPAPADVLPKGAKVLFSDSDYSNYTEVALVVFEVEGVLYEVNGSHCSCYGFEGQWSPEVASFNELRQRAQRAVERDEPDYNYYDDPRLDWKRLLERLDAWSATKGGVTTVLSA